jgi:hypothetical protein
MVLFVWHPPMVLPMMADFGENSPTNVCDIACTLLTAWDSSLGTGEDEEVFTV